MLNKKLLDILVCPACKGELIYRPGNLEQGEKQALVCKFDQLAYPIVDDIPVLLIDQAKQVSLS